MTASPSLCFIMSSIGFDVISDLNLSPDDSFNWEGKATSLYCIIPGNISNNLRVIKQTLIHLSRFYQGIFYIPGTLEYENVPTLTDRSDELQRICASIKNVASLHNHVVVIDGVAILGSNGWYDNKTTDNPIFNIEKDIQRQEDYIYLSKTLTRLQLHLDIKKIVMVTNSVPGPALFFGEQPENLETTVYPQMVLGNDSESKISHWVYGTYDKTVDATLDSIHYVSNPYFNRKPYWAKRIEVTI